MPCPVCRNEAVATVARLIAVAGAAFLLLPIIVLILRWRRAKERSWPMPTDNESYLGVTIPIERENLRTIKDIVSRFCLESSAAVAEGDSH
jgi:hypothetical protein